MLAVGYSLPALGCVTTPFCEEFPNAESCTNHSTTLGDESGSSETATTADSGDGDGDSGDGDGDSGDGDGDSGDGDTNEPDMDMDGVADASDNCPDIPNPNQLDYDANGNGNVCDTQVFTSVTGNLLTTAEVSSDVAGSCAIPIMIMVTGGQIMVQLDDDAAMAAFEIANLEVADILDQECLLLVTAILSMTNFMITNTGGPFPVDMPHSQAMHDAGQIAGISNAPHPVLLNTTLTASVNGEPPDVSELMLDGALPAFAANIMGGDETKTMSFSDPNFVLAMDLVHIEMPIPLDVDFQLTGLVGVLNLAP
jgi:hypothetical protein